MKVYFSHGKESGPWGSKITKLANIAKMHGCKVDSIDYSNITDPDVRVEHLLQSLDGEDDEEVILVGSSMGGYISLVASEKIKPKGVFLLAPALFIPGYEKQAYSYSNNVEIVHGWSDDVIPPENSIKFSKSNNCVLHLIPGDHRLKDSIETVANIFTQFLQQHKVPAKEKQ